MATPRRVLITGAASGIGLAIARAFAAQGHRLLLADVNDSVHQVARDLATDASGHTVDLADAAQLAALARHATSTLGGVDVLVNNAGISPKRLGLPAKATEIDLAEWERVLRINLTAPFLLCAALIPGMQAQRFGRIVDIASRAGRTYVPPAGSHYAASKAGLIGLTRHLAGEWAAAGITANCLTPGRVDTPLANQSAAVVQQAAVAAISVRRAGTPDEIAAAALYLASDAAAYVTGICLDVNGGAFMS